MIPSKAWFRSQESPINNEWFCWAIDEGWHQAPVRIFLILKLSFRRKGWVLTSGYKIIDESYLFSGCENCDFTPLRSFPLGSHFLLLVLNPHYYCICYLHRICYVSAIVPNAFHTFIYLLCKYKTIVHLDRNTSSFRDK